MSSSSQHSITPSATPPSSPEIDFCPPPILVRSAEVRAAFLSLHSDYRPSDSDNDGTHPIPAVPPIQLPHSVRPAVPTDEECGLRPQLDLALEQIDRASRPVVSALRNMAPATVLQGYTRLSAATAFAHYLNVLRAQGRARAVLLVSRTVATAKLWQNALLPVLDDTLDITVTQFFMAKGPRNHAVKLVGGLRFPGLVIASEKALRAPDTKPGIAMLSDAMADNPHSIKWDLVVSDAVGKDDLNDVVSPLRMLANRQTEHALLVLCADDKVKKKNAPTRILVEDFLKIYGSRILARDGERQMAWYTPKSSKKAKRQATNDENVVPIEGKNPKDKRTSVPIHSDNGINDGVVVKAFPDPIIRSTPLGALAKAKKEAANESRPGEKGIMFKVNNEDHIGAYGLEPEMERELEHLRIGAAATMTKKPRTSRNNFPSVKNVNVLPPKQEQTTPRESAHAVPRTSEGRHVSVRKRNRGHVFISDELLEYCTNGSRPASAERRKRAGCATSAPSIDIDDTVIIENSDGEEEVFYDALSWVATKPQEVTNAKGRGSASRKPPARRRAEGRKEVSMKPAKPLPSPSHENDDCLLTSGLLPSSCVEVPVQRKPRQRLSEERKFGLQTPTKRGARPHAERNDVDPRVSTDRRFTLDAKRSGALEHQRQRDSKRKRRSREAASFARPQQAGIQKSSSAQKISNETNQGPSDTVKRREGKKDRRSAAGSNVEESRRDSRRNGRKVSQQSSVERSNQRDGRRCRAVLNRTRGEASAPQPPPTADDDRVIVLDSGESDDGSRKHGQDGIFVIGDDDDPQRHSRRGPTTKRNRHMMRHSPKTSGEPAQPAKSPRSRRGNTHNLSASVAHTIQDDINSISPEDRRKYNELISRARKEEGKGPEGFSKALRLYLQGMDIYEGDCFLTTRILALSSAKRARKSDDSSPWDRPVTRSPIAKKGNGLRAQQKRGKRPGKGAKKVARPAAAGRSSNVSQSVIVIDD